MLSALYEIESQIPGLLRQAGWNSMYINYHPPVVERLWRQIGDYRVYLHRIHPCSKEQALVHPHPWPSAIRVLKGCYEMGIGYGKGMDEPPIACKMIIEASFVYEMVEPDGWHYVRPIDEPSYSLMVTGKPWDRPAPRSTEPLSPMSEERITGLMDRFKAFYW